VAQKISKKTAEEIVIFVMQSWKDELSDKQVILKLISDFHLVQTEAESAVELIRNGMGRAALLASGMQAEQFSSDLDGNPIFVAAINQARKEIKNAPSVKQKPFSHWITELESSDVESRRIAAFEIGQTFRSDAIPCLLKALNDPDQEVRIYSIQSLRDLRDKKATHSLCKLLEDETDGLILSNVLIALERIKDKSAVPALIKATQNSDPFVRIKSAWVLGEFRDQRAVPALEKLLTDHTKPQKTDKDGFVTQLSTCTISEQAEMAIKKIQRPLWKLW